MKWLLFGVLFAVGCANAQNAKQTVVTLYHNGEPIKSWHHTYEISRDGCSLRFVDNTGKRVLISGTFISEEVDE
jgi:hypothetical protein